MGRAPPAVGELSRAIHSILLAEGLGVGFAVGVEEVFGSLAPCLLEFRSGDVPVGAAFFDDGAEVLTEILHVGG
jgi:hypothetical protein